MTEIEAIGVVTRAPQHYDATKAAIAASNHVFTGSTRPEHR
jgi:predicted dehydrogenase